MIIVLPVLCLLVGLLMFVLATRAEVKEIGKIMFAVGLFVVVNNGQQSLALLTK